MKCICIMLLLCDHALKTPWNLHARRLIQIQRFDMLSPMHQQHLWTL